MLDLIKEIIRACGGRLSGSQQEQRAQQIIKEKFEAFCDSVEWHEFHAALQAKFPSLKLFCLFFYLGFGLIWFNLELAAILALVNVVLFMGHFVSYRDWLDFLFKKHPSWNVIGTIDPTEEIRSTLMVSGHIDSVPEFRWWYLLKNWGGILSMLSGILFVVQAILFIVIALSGNMEGWTLYGVIILLILSPITIVLFTIQGTRKVDGAIDNLTGIAVTHALGQFFSQKVNRLKHTRLKVISFGSEEAGLKGAAAYATENKDILKKEKAVLINIDSVKDDQHLSIIQSEINVFVKYPKYLVEGLEKAFIQESVPYKKVHLTLGASDGAAFAMRGLPAITIIGMDSSRLDPTYHTRLDVVENIDPVGMDKLKQVMCRFIEDWDNSMLDS